MSSMDEFNWGIYGYPVSDEDNTESLTEITALAWSGDFANLDIQEYHFVVDQPDPRCSQHQVRAISRVSYPDADPEIQILLEGECTANSWEQFRVLAWDSTEIAQSAFASEMSWAGTPNFK